MAECGTDGGDSEVCFRPGDRTRSVEGPKTLCESEASVPTIRDVSTYSHGRKSFAAAGLCRIFRFRWLLLS